MEVWIQLISYQLKVPMFACLLHPYHKSLLKIVFFLMEQLKGISSHSVASYGQLLCKYGLNFYFLFLFLSDLFQKTFKIFTF